ncbi:MAG: hypothetical protein IJH54_01320 [Clostridia bacterium]|nr:hypothetical protein [Clostridia bacterium]
MIRKWICALICAGLTLALLGCGSQAAAPQATPKPGVVYLDPNAAPAATATAAPTAEATAAPVTEEQAPAQTEETLVTEPEPSQEPEPEEALDLYFESKGVRIEPWMEAAPVLLALGDPTGSFEADSCAYIGKDLFYWYPGFELTVNEVEGVDRITAVTVADDTVTIPQGLRIYDEEEKLLSLLGGTDENGIYTYRDGNILLLIQVKAAEGDERRIASMEYRVAVDQ